MGGGCACIHVRADDVICRCGMNQIKYSFGAHTASSKFWPQCRKNKQTNKQTNKMRCRTKLCSINFVFHFLQTSSSQPSSMRLATKPSTKTETEKKRKKRRKKKERKKPREVFIIALSRRKSSDQSFPTGLKTSVEIDFLYAFMTETHTLKGAAYKNNKHTK